MSAAPSPVALGRPLLEREVERHRDLWCMHYDDCLSEAVKREWRGWSCAACPVKGTQQKIPELRTGGDNVLAEAADVHGLIYGKDRPQASMNAIFRRLSTAPQTITEIAGGRSQWKAVERTLRRLKARGIAATVRLGRDRGYAYGWVRTGKRICEACQIRLPAAAFGPRANSPDGIRSRCRSCEEAA